MTSLIRLPHHSDRSQTQLKDSVTFLVDQAILQMQISRSCVTVSMTYYIFFRNQLSMNEP